MQTIEGNLIKIIVDNLAHIAHIQLANKSGYHEPGTGKINYINLLRLIDEVG